MRASGLSAFWLGSAATLSLAPTHGNCVSVRAWAKGVGRAAVLLLLLPADVSSLEGRDWVDTHIPSGVPSVRRPRRPSQEAGGSPA
jgi:hypothetical protein